MTIHLVTHRKGGNAADVTPIAKRLKAAAIRHGAEDCRLSLEVAGPAAGQWVLAISFSDWSSYGRAMASAMAEPEVQGILSDLDNATEMMSRRLVAAIEM